jgi:competence protein ComEC
MTLFAVTALLLRRRSDSVTALSFSAALLLFSNPYALESFSFLLSYAATFGIVSCGAPLCEYLRFVFDKKKMHPVLRFFRSVLLSFAIASVSFLFTMPVQLLLFQTVTPFAPFYALLLLPLFHFCLVLVLLGAVLTWIPLLSAKIANSLLAIPAFFPDLVEWIAQGSPAPLTSRGVSLFLAIFFIAAIVILYWRKAPMTSVFLIYAIAFLFFGGFSLVQRILA